MPLRKLLTVYIALLSLTACSVSDLPFVYRADLQQGTVLEAERVERLEPGMSRRQVRFLVGTPDIDDPFHADRWDYTYRFVPGDGGPVTREQLTVFFDGDRLIAARGTHIDEDSELARRARRLAGE